MPCRCVRYEIAQPNTGGPRKGQVDEGDWDEVYGKDQQDIVEAWAQRYDADGDYTIVGGSEEEVWIRNEDGEITRWTVIGETVPEYHAKQINAVSAGDERG